MRRPSTQDDAVDMDDCGGKVIDAIHNSHGVPDVWRVLQDGLEDGYSASPVIGVSQNVGPVLCRLRSLVSMSDGRCVTGLSAWR